MNEKYKGNLWDIEEQNFINQIKDWKKEDIINRYLYRFRELNSELIKKSLIMTFSFLFNILLILYLFFIYISI